MSHNQQNNLIEQRVKKMLLHEKIHLEIEKIFRDKGMQLPGKGHHQPKVQDVSQMQSQRMAVSGASEFKEVEKKSQKSQEKSDKLNPQAQIQKSSISSNSLDNSFKPARKQSKQDGEIDMIDEQRQDN